MAIQRLRARTALVGLLIAVAGGAMTPTASAAPRQDDPSSVPVTWSVRPAPGPDGGSRPNFEFDVSPGQTISDQLVVVNDSDVNLVLGVLVSDAVNTPEGETDLLASDATPVDVGAWTSIESNSVTVPARGQVTVPFSITVPEDASPGDHIGGIATSLSTSEQDGEGNRVKVERRLGSRIYLRVEGDLKPELRFKDLQAEYRGSANPFAPGSVELTYVVENVGNVRLRAARTATVQPGLGFAERTSEAADMKELLPNNEMTLTHVVEGVWPAFGTDITVDLEPYDLSSETGDPVPTPVVATRSMTIVPTAALIALVVFVALLVGGLVLRQRNRRKLSAEIHGAIVSALAEQAKPSESAAPLVTAARPETSGASDGPGVPPPFIADPPPTSGDHRPDS